MNPITAVLYAEEFCDQTFSAKESVILELLEGRKARMLEGL